MSSERRRIGPIGTATRLAGGLMALVVPTVLSGISWWDIGAGLLVLPLTAALAAAGASAALGARRVRGEFVQGASQPWIRSVSALVAAIAVGVGATFVTPLDGSVAIWLFIGASLLVGALRGDAGCEAVAISNAVAGRRDLTGCVIYAPLDAIDAHRVRRPPPRDISRQEVHR
jgi:hypothetical protein